MTYRRPSQDLDGTARQLRAHIAYPIPEKVGGRRVCRVCGEPIPTNSRRRLTCSVECSVAIQLSISATTQRWAVDQRDKGICARCGCDTRKLARILAHVSYHPRPPEYVHAGSRTARDIGFSRDRASLWDMDHIVAVKDGGGIRPGMRAVEIMANLQTLCSPCHNAKSGKARAPKPAPASIDEDATLFEMETPCSSTAAPFSTSGSASSTPGPSTARPTSRR